MEQMLANKKILVVCGGFSTEREVSLRSGKAVYQALCDKGYGNTVAWFDLKTDNFHEILQQKPNLVFLALHGQGGEDGTIQGFLELAGIPYTGSGVASSALCMNKILTKKILMASEIPTADFLILNKSEYLSSGTQNVCERVFEKMRLPLVVKAPCQGSSVGVSIVRSEELLASTIEETFQYDDSILIEKYLTGTEVTVPILGADVLTVLPPIEITSENEFYDYEAKYTSGMCHHIIPARIAEEVMEKVKKLAWKTFQALQCRGLARIDFIIDKHLGPQVIEVNTLPGMTEMSLFPDAARAAGISFGDLVEKICLSAL